MQLTFTGNNPSSPQNNNRMDGYKYDSAGNLLNDGVHNYFYDAENRLLQTDGTLGTCSSATSCYAYDPDGNRVQKIDNVGGSYGDPIGTFQFLYDQEGRLIEKSHGTMWQGEIYVGNRHVASDGGNTYFLHSDWVGTERVHNTYASPGPTTFWTCTSGPFGDGFSCSGSDWSILHFTGKPHDYENNLDYFGARFNAPSFGRFMSPDPLGGRQHDPQTLNKYTYVRNNPLNLTDPTGLDFYLSCQKASATCQKDAAGNLVQGTTTTTTDANGKTTSSFAATVVTSASLQDPNSGNTGTVNENGVQITTTDANGNKSTAEGIFINGTDPASLQGSGKLSDFVFNVNGSDEKKGTLDSGGYTYTGSRNQPDVINALNQAGAFSYTAERVFGNKFHPGDLNFRFSSGAHPNLFNYGPSPHLLVSQDPRATVPVGPGYAGSFHVDSKTGPQHLACAEKQIGCTN